MKFVFLDIDGVLNHEGGKCTHCVYDIDPEHVKLLNRIIEKTDAKVVISSTWRKRFPIEEMRQMLEMRGFKGEVIDYTPMPFQKEEGGRWSKPGDEIQKWLDNNEGWMWTRYVVLDDCSLGNALIETCQVKTNWKFGLTEENAEYAIRLLNLEQVCPKCGEKVYKAQMSHGGFITLDPRYKELYTLADYKVFGVVSGLDVHRCKGG